MNVFAVIIRELNKFELVFSAFNAIIVLNCMFTAVVMYHATKAINLTNNLIFVDDSDAILIL